MRPPSDRLTRMHDFPAFVPFDLVSLCVCVRAVPSGTSRRSVDRYDRGFDMKIAAHVIVQGDDGNWFSFCANPKTDRPLFARVYLSMHWR